MNEGTYPFSAILSSLRQVSLIPFRMAVSNSINLDVTTDDFYEGQRHINSTLVNVQSILIQIADRIVNVNNIEATHHITTELNNLIELVEMFNDKLRSNQQ